MADQAQSGDKRAADGADGAAPDAKRPKVDPDAPDDGGDGEVDDGRYALSPVTRHMPGELETTPDALFIPSPFPPLHPSESAARLGRAFFTAACGRPSL